MPGVAKEAVVVSLVTLHTANHFLDHARLLTVHDLAAHWGRAFRRSILPCSCPINSSNCSSTSEPHRQWLVSYRIMVRCCRTLRNRYGFIQLGRNGWIRSGSTTAKHRRPGRFSQDLVCWELLLWYWNLSTEAGVAGTLLQAHSADTSNAAQGALCQYCIDWNVHGNNLFPRYLLVRCQCRS